MTEILNIIFWGIGLYLLYFCIQKIKLSAEKSKRIAYKVRLLQACTEFDGSVARFHNINLLWHQLYPKRLSIYKWYHEALISVLNDGIIRDVERFVRETRIRTVLKIRDDLFTSIDRNVGD